MPAYLGVDCGQAQDPAAWALCERRVSLQRAPIELGPKSVSARFAAQLHCTAYSRFALRTPYTVIVRKLATVVSIPELYRDVVMIVDCTRERAVYDMTRENPDFHGITIIPIIIGSGRHVTVDEYGWYSVPEEEIAASLAIATESQLLVVSKNGGQEEGDAEELKRQLMNMRRRVSSKRYSVGMSVDGSDVDHDDMAFAVSFNTWWAKYTGALVITPVESKKASEYNPATFGLTG